MKIASVATLELAVQQLKKSQKKIARNSTHSISRDFFPAIFSAVASPVQGWLHLPFSSRASDATKFEKIASPARAKNRSCSHGLRWLDWIFLRGYLPSLSINYVAMSKDMGKRLVQLYYIKMKISYDLGFIAIGVAMAT